MEKNERGKLKKCSIKIFFFFAQKHRKLKFDSGFFETSNIITFLKDAVKVLRMGVKLL